MQNQKNPPAVVGKDVRIVFGKVILKHINAG
jgi:hypothetical protein